MKATDILIKSSIDNLCDVLCTDKTCRHKVNGGFRCNLKHIRMDHGRCASWEPKQTETA